MLMHRPVEMKASLNLVQLNFAAFFGSKIFGYMLKKLYDENNFIRKDSSYQTVPLSVIQDFD